MEQVRILALGDLVGRPGRNLLVSKLEFLREQYQPHILIVNAENAAGGMGLSAEIAADLKEHGVDVITLGDHTWQRNDIKPYLRDHTDHCIRPANYPGDVPGRGWVIWQGQNGHKVGVFNLLGRVFINGALDCPFRRGEEILEGPLAECKVRVCDLHAEASSEKWAFARRFDGELSFLFGTHTHVQTSDNQVLPGGTGYITDLGMSGPSRSVLGLKSEISIKRFTSGMRYSYEVGEGPGVLRGALCVVDGSSGKAQSVERVEVWE